MGYQHSHGDFVMGLDGDMQQLPGFLRKALGWLAAEPKLSGVARVIEDTSIVTEPDRARVASGALVKLVKSVLWLYGAGLYRRAAIAEVGGYAANRNLKAWEEAELGMRLTTAGWSLERIAVRSTLHTGHSDNTFSLLRKRLVSRRAMANGVLIKQSLGKPWLPKVLLLLGQALLTRLLWVAAIAAIGISIAAQRWGRVAGFVAILAVLGIAFALYKQNHARALVSLGLYHYMAAALLLGLREKVVSQTEPIRSLKLSSPPRG